MSEAVIEPGAVAPAPGQVFSRESSGFVRVGSPWRMLLLPDHPTPVRLKTHTTDSVPYLLVDSHVDGPGGFYSESATADVPAVPGHSLMGRLIIPSP